MKKLIYLLVILLLLAFTACSEKDNPSEVKILGYKLDQFINPDTVRIHIDPQAEADLEYRSLFAYEIVSSTDGFSPRQSAYAGYDLPWKTFSQGYYVPNDDHRTWFPGMGLPSAFKVRNAGLFRLYRKVDVDAGNRGSKLIELRGLSTYTVDNWSGTAEDAIKLSDLLQGIAAYDSVAFVAVDGYSKNYQPEHINDGYYLLNSEVTTFPNFNSTLPGNMKKFKKLAKINVYGATSAQNFDFALAPQEKADLTFTIPSDLSGFESTEMVTEK